MEFLVIACDGVWDCRSSQQVVTYYKQKRHQLLSTNHQLLDSLVPPTLDKLKSNKGIGSDNMTILVVDFKHPPMEEE